MRVQSNKQPQFGLEFLKSRLTDNNFKIDAEFIIEESDNETMLGMTWISATRNKDNHLMVAVVDPKDEALKQLHYDNFIFDSKSGFSNSGLYQIFNALVNGTVTTTRMRKKSFRYSLPMKSN